MIGGEVWVMYGWCNMYLECLSKPLKKNFLHEIELTPSLLGLILFIVYLNDLPSLTLQGI